MMAERIKKRSNTGILAPLIQHKRHYRTLGIGLKRRVLPPNPLCGFLAASTKLAD